MGFFRTLFGRGRDKPATFTASSYATHGTPPPRRIGYDENLIASLQRDHAELGSIYSRIGELHQAGGSYDEIRSLLANFKSCLEAHVLAENVRFYNYLEQTLPDDSDNAEIMRGFRREMNQIARQVLDFVKRYQACGFDAAERVSFGEDYAAIGKVLEQRLDREEHNLYPLYGPA